MSAVVVNALVLVLVVPSEKVPSRFTGVKIFTDPDGLAWIGSYYVFENSPQYQVYFYGQGDTEKVIDCSPGYRMSVYVSLDAPYSGDVTIQSWDRGEMREIDAAHDSGSAQVGAIC